MKTLHFPLLCIAIVYATSLLCMEKNIVHIGAFSYTQPEKEQTTEYDIKRLDNNIIVGLYEGHSGKAITTFLKKNYIRNVVKNYTHNNSLDSLTLSLQECDNEALKVNKFHPFAHQASTVIASWFDTTSQTGNLILLGDLNAYLIGPKSLSITTPNRLRNFRTQTFNFIGEAQAKSLFKTIFIEPCQYCYDSKEGYNYLILATPSLYNALAQTDDHARYNDFKKIFTDALTLSDETFNQRHPLPKDMHSIAPKKKIAPQRTFLSSNLNTVTHSSIMDLIAQRLAQVALSRRCTDNITIIVQALNYNSVIKIPLQP